MGGERTGEASLFEEEIKCPVCFQKTFVVLLFCIYKCRIEIWGMTEAHGFFSVCFDKSGRQQGISSGECGNIRRKIYYTCYFFTARQ